MNHFSRVVITAACLLLVAGPGNAQNPKQPGDAAKAVAQLIADLKGKDNQASAAAREALGPDGPYAKTALPALIDALNEPDRGVQWNLAELIAEYGPRAVPSLIDALKRPNVNIRVSAAEALGKVRPRPVEAVPALIAAMKDPEPEVRAAAARGLREMRRAADKVIPVLVAGLNDPEFGVRYASAEGLGNMVRKPGPAIEALARAVSDEGFGVRWEAAIAIGRIGPAAKAAVPILTAQLRRGWMRAPVSFLGRIGRYAQPGWPVMSTVAVAAALALDKMDDDDNPSRQAFVAWALAGIGPPAKDAVPPLIEALHDPDRSLRRFAARALGEIGPDAASAVPQLLAMAKNKKDKERDEALWALGGIGPAAKEAVPILIEELADRKYTFRPCEVAMTLAEIGPNAKAAVPALTALVRNRREDDQVREYAAKAVMKIDPAFAAREGMEFAYLNVRLGKVPPVRLKPRPPATDEQAKRIKALIAELAKIDKPDFGLSGTLTGTAFAPLPGSGKMQAGLLTNHQLGTSAAFRSLVELGPTALPFLLDALGDKTPTGLKVRKLIVLAVGGSLPDGNPFNAKEKKALAMEPAPGTDDDYEDAGLVESYTVTVGDVCYVAIGQIVGRQYLAVRYIPTGITGVCSPTASPLLRDQLRAAWGGPDPAKVLLDSLLTDYTTEGLFNGNSLDGWDEGSDFQVRAVTRLLYYFPAETAPLVAARLRSLDVMVPKVRDGRMLRDVKNGVRTAEFIEAVSWCKAAPIREALADISKRTDDPYIKEALAAGPK